MAPSTFSNANFPTDQDGRTYHVSTKPGEVAQRVITVGDVHRAEELAQHLDDPKGVFSYTSKRGFTTITGKFKGVPVSIVAIGMGVSMMDFFVRETRAVVDGPMVIIRFGSCGSIGKAPIGAVVAAEASVMVTRNYDHFTGSVSPPVNPYNISQPVPADAIVTKILHEKLSKHLGHGKALTGLNATGDSFYSSQGRLGGNFLDENDKVISTLRTLHPNVQTLEMETYILLHLAACSRGTGAADDAKPTIRAAGCHMIFAQRDSNDFIAPEEIARLQKVGGLALLEAITEVKL